MDPITFPAVVVISTIGGFYGVLVHRHFPSPRTLLSPLPFPAHTISSVDIFFDIFFPLSYPSFNPYSNPPSHYNFIHGQTLGSLMLLMNFILSIPSPYSFIVTASSSRDRELIVKSLISLIEDGENVLQSLVLKDMKLKTDLSRFLGKYG